MAILTQGQNYAGGTVKYDTGTGKPLAQGQVTASNDALNQDFSKQIPQADLMSFQKANPGLTFTGQDYAQYQNSAITPSSMTTKSPYTPAVPVQTPIPDLTHLTPADNPANTPSQLTPTESRIKTQLDELMGVNKSLEGKSSYTAQQNEALGVNAASDAITGLNSQLTGLINESKAIPLAIQQNAQQGGANVTKGGLAPIQTAQLRNNAIQSLAVSSQIDAMNGQLSNAIKKVDRAVALKYGDLEARSAALTKNLELLKSDPSLSVEQKDRVDKKLAEQKVYDDQIAKQKKTETDTHDAILKTLSNNSGNPKLTPQVIAALQAAKTPEEVLALQNYFGLSSLTQQEAQSIASSQQSIESSKQQMELAAKKSPYELAKLQAETSKAQAEAKTAVQGEAPVSPEVLNGMLNAYKSTGVIPAFGLSAKNPLRAQFYAALGSDGNIVNEANTNKVVRAGLNKAYSTQQNQYTANQTAIGTLDKQLELAKQYSDKVSRTDSPLVNRYLVAAKTGIFGDKDTAALNNIVTTAAYEFSKILSGSAASIAGATVSSQEDAKNLLNAAMSKGQFNEVLALMQKESQFRLKSQKETLDSIKNDLGNVGSIADTAKETIVTPTQANELRSKYNY